MYEPAAMFDHLINLTISFEEPGPPVAADLEALTLSLLDSVPCYRGLEMTVFSNGHPIVLTAFPPQPGTDPHRDSDRTGGRRMTSLRVPLTLLGNRFEAGTQVVFYAGCPGAFSDLAANLAAALATPVITETLPWPEDHGGKRPGSDRPGAQKPAPDAGPAQSIRLPVLIVNGDRAPIVSGATIRGLAELRDLNRAAGMMIADGFQPGEVYAALRRSAADARLSPHAYALRLLYR